MDKHEAEKHGRELLDKMHTKGWKLRVWENAGWNYSISKGYISVYPSYRNDTFWTLMGDPAGVGEVYFRNDDHDTFKDPNKAVANQLKVAFKHLEKVTKMISESL